MTLSKKTEALMTPIKHNRERIFAILLDEFDKKLYTYGDHWGRGGEILYQAFGLKMPKAVDDLTKKAGFAEVKQEKV